VRDIWDESKRGRCGSAGLAQVSPFQVVRREFFPGQSGTVGTKVRGGREPAGSAKTENFRLGHPGQKDAWDENGRAESEWKSAT
ncbi:hypothetical protein KI387_011201, partial [Taxus chinensis]